MYKLFHYVLEIQYILYTVEIHVILYYYVNTLKWNKYYTNERYQSRFFGVTNKLCTYIDKHQKFRRPCGVALSDQKLRFTRDVAVLTLAMLYRKVGRRLVL